MSMLKEEEQDQNYIKASKPTLKEGKNKINVIGAPKKKANT